MDSASKIEQSSVHMGIATYDFLLLVGVRHCVIPPLSLSIDNPLRPCQWVHMLSWIFSFSIINFYEFLVWISSLNYGRSLHFLRTRWKVSLKKTPKSSKPGFFVVPFNKKPDIRGFWKRNSKLICRPARLLSNFDHTRVVRIWTVVKPNCK